MCVPPAHFTRSGTAASGRHGRGPLRTAWACGQRLGDGMDRLDGGLRIEGGERVWGSTSPIRSSGS